MLAASAQGKTIKTMPACTECARHCDMLHVVFIAGPSTEKYDTPMMIFSLRLLELVASAAHRGH